jgi:uncharacterized protein
MDWLVQPWPWWVAGPVIGLFVPALLLIDNRLFGISSTLRHTCAAVLPGRAEFFRHDWREAGGWNLTFAAGILVGGFIASTVLAGPDAVAISAATRADLAALGITDFSGLVPADLFSWAALLTPRGLAAVVVGGFLVGFGSAYAGGCTSGHAITGMADLQVASVIAAVGFFAGGLAVTHLVLPWIV